MDEVEQLVRMYVDAARIIGSHGCRPDPGSYLAMGHSRPAMHL